MREVTLTVNKPQAQFAAMKQKYRALVAGYGASKTFTGSIETDKHFLMHPRVNQGYFAPTYGLIHDIYYPTIDEVSALFGLSVSINESNHEVHVYNGREYLGTQICRSMENPSNIIGFKIGRAHVDEMDVLPINKARESWRKIIARVRNETPGVKNGIDITTTPEGFRWTHETFVKKPAENPELLGNYGLLQVSTYDNERYLNTDYIPSLIEAYPAELIEAYINGQFVNLTSGTVYRNYDRERCRSRETIHPGEPLMVGMDFNVQKMAAVIYVVRPGGWHAVAGFHNVFDTPDMITLILETYPKHRVIVYPDTTGGSRKSVDASKSDISLLRNARFTVMAKSTNPPVKDRIISMNKSFEDGKLKVNDHAIPWLAESLEQQAYTDNGEPDKTSGHDHANDAAGYPIVYEMPVKRPTRLVSIAGM